MNTRKTTLQAALAACLAVAGLSTPAVHAATITPNIFADEVTANTDCSLREAIMSINAGVDIGGCVHSTNAYGINDTINIPEGTYTLSIAPLADDVPSGTGTANTALHFSEYTLNWGGSTYSVTVTPDAASGDLDIEKA